MSADFFDLAGYPSGKVTWSGMSSWAWCWAFGRFFIRPRWSLSSPFTSR